MKRLPLYAEQALAELRTTRGVVASEFEKQFRETESVTCKAGCAHCCYYPLTISIGEALLLHRSLSTKGRFTTAFRKRLEEHANITVGLDPTVWMMSKIACPLLDEKNQCVGYEGRPLSCRMLFSAGVAEKCDPQAFDPSDQANRQVLQTVRAFEDNLLRRHGISTYRMPVGQALHFAERVLSQDISLGNIAMEAVKELG